MFTTKCALCGEYVITTIMPDTDRRKRLSEHERACSGGKPLGLIDSESKSTE